MATPVNRCNDNNNDNCAVHSSPAKNNHSSVKIKEKLNAGIRMKGEMQKKEKKENAAMFSSR